MKLKSLPFKKGNVVSNGRTCILVTGAGEHNTRSSFSGVIISSAGLSLGLYSTSWNTNAFKIVDIHIEDIVSSALFLLKRKKVKKTTSKKKSSLLRG